MSDAGRVLGITHLSAGLVLILVAIPLIRRRVKMNPWYGVRIPKAFESAASWYAINEYGGRMLVVAGTALAVVGLGATLWPPASVTAVLTMAIAPLPVLAIALLRIFRFARKLR